MKRYAEPEFDAGGIPDDELSQLAEYLRWKLDAVGAAAVVYLPSNGTRYMLTFHDAAPLRDPTEPMEELQGDTLVALLSFGTAHCFNLRARGPAEVDYLHPTYVSEKLRCTLGDGAAVANLLESIAYAEGSS